MIYRNMYYNKIIEWDDLQGTNFTLITFLNFEPFKLIEFFNLNKTAPTAWI